MLNMLKDQVVVQLADYRIFLFISNNHKNNKIIEKISDEFDENIPNGTDILLSANFEEIILLDEYDDNLENKYNPNLSIIKIGHKGSLFDKI